jgi:hypothetical protein
LIGAYDPDPEHKHADGLAIRERQEGRVVEYRHSADDHKPDELLMSAAVSPEVAVTLDREERQLGTADQQRYIEEVCDHTPRPRRERGVVGVADVHAVVSERTVLP